MSFGENLRFLRKRNNLSQEDLARVLRYRSYTTIQKWEKDQAMPPDNVIEYIARLFHVSVDALVSDNPISETPIFRPAPSKDPLAGVRPFMPPGYVLGYRSIVQYEGKTTAEDPYIVYPDGKILEIYDEELEDIIEDALAVMAYRLDKFRREQEESGL